MKNLISFLIFFSIAFSIYGQDTLTYFIDGSGKQTQKEKALYWRMTFKTSTEKWLVKDYDMDGWLKSSGNYLSKQLNGKTGIHKFFYEKGELKSQGSFKKDKRTGAWKGYYLSGKIKYEIHYLKDEPHGPTLAYWEDGTIRREDQFKYGELKQGICYNNEGKVIKHYNFNQMPEFPGGINALMQFLSKNVKYPPSARANGIQGKVYITFVINKEGNIEQIEVLRGVNEILDNEAIRVIKEMPKWSPGIQFGDFVDVTYNLPINFRFK